MSFMEPQITHKIDWLIIDGPMGTDCVPADIVGYAPPDDSFEFDVVAAADALADYTENPIGGTAEQRERCEISYTSGYGARISAPGYMDCTGWTVHDSRADAACELLDAHYGAHAPEDSDAIAELEAIVHEDDSRNPADAE